MIPAFEEIWENKENEYAYICLYNLAHGLIHQNMEIRVY